MDKRKKYREDHHSWKGGRYLNDSGYVMVYDPNHHRSSYNGYVREHIVIAEKVLGKRLPDNAQIHHCGERKDNCSIIICNDQEYHYLIHSREKAFNECGNPNYRKCKFCKKYDDISNLYCKSFKDKNGWIGGWNIYHMECVRKYDRERYKRKKNGFKELPIKSHN